MSTPTAVALVPARAGSSRVPNKNIRPLCGHPLIAYTLAAARASGIFSAIVVSTDSPHIARIAEHYGGEVPFLRPPHMATATSPDIEWVRFTLQGLRERNRRYDAFSILRPTSPFRKPDTIRRAWRQFLATAGIDSLRAVEKCAQHPYKMWVLQGERMEPFVSECPADGGPPWHSRQYQALPPVYVQNASLEIAWERAVVEHGSISGNALAPFITEGDEGFDINTPEDWWLAEHLATTGRAVLPVVMGTPFCA